MSRDYSRKTFSWIFKRNKWDLRDWNIVWSIGDTSTFSLYCLQTRIQIHFMPLSVKLERIQLFPHMEKFSSSLFFSFVTIYKMYHSFWEFSSIFMKTDCLIKLKRKVNYMHIWQKVQICVRNTSAYACHVLCYFSSFWGLQVLALRLLKISSSLHREVHMMWH